MGGGGRSGGRGGGGRGGGGLAGVRVVGCWKAPSERLRFASVVGEHEGERSRRVRTHARPPSHHHLFTTLDRITIGTTLRTTPM
jgi:hypothetical protein